MPKADHLDIGLSPAERASALLDQMTLEEKAHQLTGVMAWRLARPDGSDADDLDTALAAPPGHVAQLIMDDPAQLGRMIERIQRALVERTRLGIPALFHAEALNGFLAGGHMSFPTAIGLASTWSSDLVEQMADLIRRQMIRTGMRHALSPVMDVAVDPRWGRVHETYGEDPYLVASMSVAFTRGLQTADLRDGVIATGKHFLGYAAPEGGLNASSVLMGSRRMRDVYAFPFEAAINLAGLGSVMNSYSEMDGIPAAASREILTDLLRDKLGFDGFVSADYASIEQLMTRQGVAATLGEAGRLALSAGLDVEFPEPRGYGDALVEEVRAGRLDECVVDTAVHRVLSAKFDLGLFENPYPAERIEVEEAAREGEELSRELAARSIVLLKNDGLLPLRKGLKVAIVGPHATTAALQFATYTYPNWRAAVDAIHLGGEGNMVGAASAADAWYQQLFAAADPEDLVRERYGAESLAEAVERSASVVVIETSGVTALLSDEERAAALDAAHAADVVILALGGASLWFNGERTEGEASDTADISLPAGQADLAQAVADIGKPRVTVLFQGRPYVLPPAVQESDAVLVGSYGGPFGASAVADVIFGDANPSGRLPYSIPRHGGQIPVYHYQKRGSGYRTEVPAASAHHYLDLPATPLFPFGFGLSYTEFAFHPVDAPASVPTDGEFSITVDVENTGSRAAASVVQLYLRFRGGAVTRPVQQLAGFARVELERGETRRVSFRVSCDLLGATDERRVVSVSPGTVEYFVGTHSDDIRVEGSVSLDGPRRDLHPAERSYFSEIAIS